MKKQFANTVEKLENDSLRAVNVVNHDTGAEIVCGATGAELIAKHGSIETFFNDLFKKGIKAIRITDKIRNGSQAGKPTYRKYGDEYIFEFAPKEAVAPVVETQHLSGLNAGMNGTIYRDMDYPRIQAELETSKAEVKRLTDANRTLETKILVIETLDGKSIEAKKANTEFMQTFGPMFAPLVEKLAGKMDTPAPGLNAANLSEVKQNAIKMVSQLQDDLVENIAFIISRLNNEEIMNEMLSLSEKAEKYN